MEIDKDNIGDDSIEIDMDNMLEKNKYIQHIETIDLRDGTTLRVVTCAQNTIEICLMRNTKSSYITSEGMKFMYACKEVVSVINTVIAEHNAYTWASKNILDKSNHSTHIYSFIPVQKHESPNVLDLKDGSVSTTLKRSSDSSDVQSTKKMKSIAAVVSTSKTSTHVPSDMKYYLSQLVNDKDSNPTINMLAAGLYRLTTNKSPYCVLPLQPIDTDIFDWFDKFLKSSSIMLNPYTPETKYIASFAELCMSNYWHIASNNTITTSRSDFELIVHRVESNWYVVYPMKKTISVNCYAFSYFFYTLKTGNKPPGIESRLLNIWQSYEFYNCIGSMIENLTFHMYLACMNILTANSCDFYTPLAEFKHFVDYVKVQDVTFVPKTRLYSNDTLEISGSYDDHKKPVIMTHTFFDPKNRIALLDDTNIKQCGMCLDENKENYYDKAFVDLVGEGIPAHETMVKLFTLARELSGLFERYFKPQCNRYYVSVAHRLISLYNTKKIEVTSTNKFVIFYDINNTKLFNLNLSTLILDQHEQSGAISDFTGVNISLQKFLVSFIVENDKNNILEIIDVIRTNLNLFTLGNIVMVVKNKIIKHSFFDSDFAKKVEKSVILEKTPSDVYSQIVNYAVDKLATDNMQQFVINAKLTIFKSNNYNFILKNHDGTLELTNDGHVDAYTNVILNSYLTLSPTYNILDLNACALLYIVTNLLERHQSNEKMLNNYVSILCNNFKTVLDTIDCQQNSQTYAFCKDRSKKFNVHILEKVMQTLTNRDKCRPWYCTDIFETLTLTVQNNGRITAVYDRGNPQVVIIDNIRDITNSVYLILLFTYITVHKPFIVRYVKMDDDNDMSCRMQLTTVRLAVVLTSLQTDVTIEKLSKFYSFRISTLTQTESDKELVTDIDFILNWLLSSNDRSALNKNNMQSFIQKFLYFSCVLQSNIPSLLIQAPLENISTLTQNVRVYDTIVIGNNAS